MGTISSGVGLVSGINIQQLVDQLIQIEARPRAIVEQRVAVLQSQKTALLEVNARLLSLKSAASEIKKTSLFSQKTVASSNTAVMIATAGSSAPAGNYSLVVDRLVATHQLISKGLTDANNTPVGAGTLRFESEKAKLDTGVRLADLNGAAGIQRGQMRITDRAGGTAVIDLSRAVTLADVLQSINTASGINVTASLDGDQLRLTDNTGSTANDLIVQDLGGRTPATDLGLAGSFASSSVLGTQINRLGSNSSLVYLNDGLGMRTVGDGQNDLNIHLRDGSDLAVALNTAKSVGDVINTINAAATTAGKNLVASVGSDQVSLQLTDGTVGGDTLTVTALNGSSAAADLGLLGSDGDADGDIEGSRLLAHLGSRLLRNLNGGSGIASLGNLSITDRAGNGTVIDVSAVTSVKELIATVNAATAGAGVAVSLSLNSAGNGLLATDASGSTAGNLIITDTSGTAAADLGLDTGGGGVAATTVNGGDRDLQYISTNTRLASLNGGKGVPAGKFKITDRNGISATVDLTQGNEVTIQDVINEINSRPNDIVATINATGDGILLTDTSGGTLRMKVEEEGSTTAKSLGLLGEDTDDDGIFDGSFERSITISATDTLNQVRDAINAAGLGATASILNDGSAIAPFRLSLTGSASGEGGRFLVDDGGLLDFSTLVQGQDAVAFVGSADPAQALLVTSNTNALPNTIQGVSINLLSTSSQPVQLTVSANTTSVVDAVKRIVTGFNDLIDKINQHDSFDKDTNQKGLLLGDATVSLVRRQLYSLFNSRSGEEGSAIRVIGQVGLSIGSGAKLQLDETKLQAALAANPDAVVQFFTATTQVSNAITLPPGVSVPGTGTTTQPVGFGSKLDAAIQSITDSVNGSMTRRTGAIDKQVQQANERITQINKLLESRRQILENQFFAMERALASLQSQQSSLTNLSNLAASAQS